MKVPFVWRRTAEDEAAIWKAEAHRQRVRADEAVRHLSTEVSCRRTIAELYSELFDHLVLSGRPSEGPVGTAERTPEPLAFDRDRARVSADRIAELTYEVARGRAAAAASRQEVEA